MIITSCFRHVIGWQMFYFDIASSSVLLLHGYRQRPLPRTQRLFVEGGCYVVHCFCSAVIKSWWDKNHSRNTGVALDVRVIQFHRRPPGLPLKQIQHHWQHLSKHRMTRCFNNTMSLPSTVTVYATTPSVYDSESVWSVCLWGSFNEWN